MAEVQQGGGGGGKHKGSSPKQKKKSTRVDMTAMVDVAFLLLTFFILTTTMQKQKAMELFLPAKDKEKQQDAEQKVAADKVMTLILGDRDSVYYYVGVDDPILATTNYSSTGLRQVLVDFINQKDKDNKKPLCPPGTSVNCWDPIFVIKPSKTCRYQNVVDILDEMRIVKAPKYALTDVSPADSTMMANQNKK